MCVLIYRFQTQVFCDRYLFVADSDKIELTFLLPIRINCKCVRIQNMNEIILTAVFFCFNRNIGVSGKKQNETARIIINTIANFGVA